jgi:hypothetical protein
MTEQKQSTLRQADNEVVVEGILSEVNLVERESAAKENYINGKIIIEVGEGETHTFSVFCKELKKDGTENKLYEGLQTVIKDYISVAKVGKEEADKVRIKQGQLGVNDYAQAGVLKSFPELSTNRITRVKPNEKFEPKAKFDVELVVQSVSEETDRDGEETGRVKVKGYVPQFGGKIAPLEFVADGAGAEFIRENYEAGHTVNINGLIINRVETKVTETEQGFGKPKKKVTEKFFREFLITGGSEPYDEEDKNAYKMEVIKKALAEREVYLEGLIKKDEEKSKKGNKGAAKKEEKKGGFGTKPSEKKTIDISDDDLPF